MKLNRRIYLVVLLIAFGSASALAQSAPATPAPDKVTEIAPPEHPATADQIREYLAITNAVETAHKVMQQSIKTSRITSAPYFTASFWDDMESAVMNIDIAAPCIPAFQKYFSKEDMAATITFYKTPAGQRLLAAQPFITSAIGDVLRNAGREAGKQVGLKHKDEIERLMKESAPASSK
jgi:uncharacterized protein